MKSKLYLVQLFFCIIIVENCFGQIPSRIYPRPLTAGFPYQGPGTCAPIIQTSDGGYIFNYSYTYAHYQYPELISHIVKTDASFNPLWRKFLDGPNGKKTLTFNDGSSILFSNSVNTNFTNSFTLLKIDAAGQTIWKKNNYAVFPLKITIEDGFIKDASTIKLAGFRKENSSTTKPILMDFDLNGNFTSGHYLNSTSFLYINKIESMCVDSNGDFYSLISNGLDKQCIAKLSSTNTVLWTKSLNLTNTNSDFLEGKSIIILSNGDILTGSNIYDADTIKFSVLISRITSNGDLVWSKTISNSNNSISHLQELASNDVIVTGRTGTDHNTDQRSLVFKLDSDGNLIWSKKYSPSFSISPAYQISPNDWYFTAYRLNSDHNKNQPMLFHTDNSGNSTCNQEDANLILMTKSISLVSENLTLAPITLLNPLVITTGGTETQTSIDECIVLSNPEFNKNDKIIIYPNPSNGIVNISSNENINNVQVFNVLGQKVLESKPSVNELSIKIEDSGIYLIKIETEIGTKVFKVIIRK